MARLTGSAGIIAVCLMIVTLQRAPLVWIDEVYFVSSVRPSSAMTSSICTPCPVTGSAFRSFRPNPWEHWSRSLRVAWADRIHPPTVAQPEADFLLWPDDPLWPMPESLACAAVFPVARYDAPSSRRLLDRLTVAGGLAALRRHASTVLYHVPDGCRI